ncbi:hypothetical protein [uncultured Methanospirillum sp.]|uniref:hypothetical protein n=1 Tax=uncultured Methanospirillum sp. TaxID=262503 RepID=UPI0029C72AE6|nr:hypothetical protein [uncultured Methanospirillum sp.]
MNRITGEIAEILAPVIGSGLAISTVNMQCKKMGRSPDLLSIDDLDAFADMIHIPLELFAGARIAEKLAGEIRQIQ